MPEHPMASKRSYLYIRNDGGTKKNNICNYNYLDSRNKVLLVFSEANNRKSGIVSNHAHLANAKSA